MKKNKHTFTADEFVQFVAVARILRGNQRGYTNAMQYAIDRNAKAVQNLEIDIEGEKTMNRIKNAMKADDASIFEVQVGDAIRYKYSLEGRTSLEKGHRDIMKKARTSEFYWSDDIDWEIMVDAATYDVLRGFLFDPKRSYDFNKAVMRRAELSAAIKEVIAGPQPIDEKVATLIDRFSILQPLTQPNRE